MYIFSKWELDCVKEVWNKKQKSELIVSVLKNIPLPAIYICQDENFHEEIFDGKQRLTSILSFMNNEIELTEQQIIGYDLKDKFKKKVF